LPGALEGITYSDTINCNCKGRQSFKYVITFDPTGTESVYKAYAHIEIEGAARDVIDEVTLHYALRTDRTGKYSDEKTVSFRWKTDDNEPEKIPQYLGDIFMDKDISGSYYYNKSNIIILSKDIDCIPNRIRNSPTNAGTFSDTRDGHVYKWVRVGNQIWMAENLNYVTYNSHCYGDNVTSTVCKQYGQLYKWDDAQKVCPPGWHLPSEDDIDNLLADVGGAGKIAYKQMILDGNSAFDALPGGFGRGFNGGSEFRFTPPGNGDYYTAFWSSSVSTGESCANPDPNNNSSSSRYGLGFDRFGSAGKYTFCSVSDWLYIRCVKDKVQDNSLQTKIIENQKNIQAQTTQLNVVKKTEVKQPEVKQQTNTPITANTQAKVDNTKKPDVKQPEVKQQTNTQVNTGTQVKVDNGDNTKKPDVKQPEVKQPNAINLASTNKFFVIIESFPSEESAEEEVSSLKKNGYPNAKVVGLSSSGTTWRISCADFASKAEATAGLPTFKKDYPSAWVFEKK